MKKQKIKLSLKKQKISSFKNHSIYGGNSIAGRCIVFPSDGGSCDPRCTSAIDRGNRCNSDNGCYGGPDETLTCDNASCSCPGGPVIIG